MKRMKSYIKGKNIFFRKSHLTSVKCMYLTLTKMLFKIFRAGQLKENISNTHPYQFVLMRLLVQIY